MKCSLLFFTLLPLIAFAQQSPQPPPDADPIGRYLIPPEMVMMHAQEIALTDAQSSSIKSEVCKAQSRFLDLQWDDPVDSEANISWTRAFFGAMEPFLERGVYVNDLGDEGEDRVRAAYGANYERLAIVKAHDGDA